MTIDSGRSPGHSGLVPVGRITGIFGLQGWVKIHSYTDPAGNILNFSCWHLSRGDQDVIRGLIKGQMHGKAVIAHLAGCDDRDQADTLVGCEIAVPRSDLPALAPGQYYWAELIGLDVVTLDGTSLGRLERLIETGANDVMIIHGERERLIPFIKDQVIRDVDLDCGVIRVDWQSDY
ncbi:MAG: ribosome maturation factor RimM [Gammaproteobacteria bacterium]|nr:MAG: ribosome maturation factor RimM [Gammaproteobacteria bacterium]